MKIRWWLVVGSYTNCITVVPHKVVAEVSEEETYRKVGCCESWMAERSHSMTERWLESRFLEWLQWLQWSPHPQMLDALWCSAVVVVIVV